MKLQSFAERALLNTTYLAYCYPSNCNETKIDTPKESVLETLKSLDINHFDKPKKTDISHRIMKPVRVLARTVYFVAVGCLVAPLGVIWNGALTCKHLCSYSIQTTAQGKSETWKKVAECAKALLTDLSVTALGGLSGFFAVSCTAPIMALSLISPVTEVIATIAIAAFGLGMSGFLSGAILTNTTMPEILAWDKERAGLYISLKLRNDFGLVNKDGGLLPSNEVDAITIQLLRHNHFQFSGTGDTNLTTFIYETELDMVRLVAEASQLLKNHNRAPIPFQYPFSANRVAQHIQNNLPAHNQEELLGLKEKIVRFGQKIDLLRNMHRTAREMAVNGSLIEQIITKKTGYTWSTQPKSYVRQEEYSFYYATETAQANGPEPVRGKPDDLSRIILNANLEPLDPNTYAPAADESTYDRFRNQLRMATWKLQRNQRVEAYTLLGLAAGYTSVESKRAIRAHQLALHPDRQANSPESTALFQIFAEIKNKIDE